jgi:positive regulator of sigma E activity
LRISRKIGILIGRRILLYLFPSLLVTLIVDTSLFWLLTAHGTRVACLCILTRSVIWAVVQQKN